MNLPEGKHTAKVFCFIEDENHNILVNRENTTTFYIDNTPPRITVDLNNNSNILNLNISANDNLSNIIICKLSINSETYSEDVNLGFHNNESKEFIRFLPDGNYNLRITCLDMAGNFSTYHKTFTVSTNIFVKNPKILVNTTPIIFEWENEKECDVYLDNTLICDNVKNYCEYNSPISEGEHNYLIKCDNNYYGVFYYKWYPNYKYRKKLIINVSDNVNSPIKVKINDENIAQSYSLIITDENNKPVPYWIMEKSDNNIIIYLSDNFSAGDNNYFIYYGGMVDCNLHINPYNSEVFCQGNPKDVFLYFNDFENLNGLIVGSPHLISDNGVLSLIPVGEYGYEEQYVIAPISISKPYVVEIKYWDNFSAGGPIFIVKDENNWVSWEHYVFSNRDIIRPIFNDTDKGWVWHQKPSSRKNKVWEIEKNIVYSDFNIDLYVNDEFKRRVKVPAKYHFEEPYVGIGIVEHVNFGPMKVDWILVYPHKEFTYSYTIT